MTSSQDAVFGRRNARRALAHFFSILIIGSAICEALLIRAGDSIRNHLVLVLTLMWMPAIASFWARWRGREGIEDVSFRFGGAPGARMALLAWLCPLAIGLLAYGAAWTSGLAQFRPADLPGIRMPSTPLPAFLLLLAVRLIIGVPIAAIAAAGEEIGWRGYMLPRLIELGAHRPILLSGLIWAVWHIPLVLAGVYAAGPNAVLAAAIFVVVIVALGCLLARVRLTSGSVWPAIVGHASWNATIQGVFDFSTVPAPSVWVGESGILVALAATLVATIAFRGSWPRLIAPGKPLVARAAA